MATVRRQRPTPVAASAALSAFSPSPAWSGFQLPGTIGIVGPPPKSSPARVVKPAAAGTASLAYCAGKAQRTRALTIGLRVLGGGAPQSGSTLIFISMNSSPYPRIPTRRRRRRAARARRLRPLRRASRVRFRSLLFGAGTGAGTHPRTDTDTGRPQRVGRHKPVPPAVRPVASTRNLPRCSRSTAKQAPWSFRVKSRSPLPQGYWLPTANWAAAASVRPTRRERWPRKSESRPGRLGPRCPPVRRARRTESPQVGGSTRLLGARGRTRRMPARQCRLTVG